MSQVSSIFKNFLGWIFMVKNRRGWAKSNLLVVKKNCNVFSTPKKKNNETDVNSSWIEYNTFSGSKSIMNCCNVIMHFLTF